MKFEENWKNDGYIRETETDICASWTVFRDAISSSAVFTTSSWFYDVLLESKGAFYSSALLRRKKKSEARQ